MHTDTLRFPPGTAHKQLAAATHLGSFSSLHGSYPEEPAPPRFQVILAGTASSIKEISTGRVRGFRGNDN